MKYTLDVTPAVHYAETLRRAPDVVRSEIGAGIDEASSLLVREVKDTTPVGVTEALRASIISERRDSGPDVQAAVFSPLNYAAAVELGTRPHYPPIEPLQDWVRKKLDVTDEDDVRRVARLIMWKIGRKGTKPLNMFGSSLGRLTPQMSEILRRAFARALERLSKGR
ncbi:MAG: HK97 gp10 family phage protein [Burkholderiales bacterium]